MGKFEKGQYVRRTNGTSFTTATGHHEAGFVGQIKDIIRVFGREDLLFTNGHKGIADQYEAWQPKVGERVQVNYGHGWDGQGVVDRISYDTVIVKMNTGAMSGDEGGFRVESLAPFTEPATLTIKAGKFYKTRDGRKVGPMDGWVSGQFRTEVGNGKFWTGDGKGVHVPDIIAEWVDEPVVQPAKASNDNAEPAAKPKFKVGDRVNVTGNRPYLVSKIGKSGVIETVHGVGEYTVRLDNSDSFSFIDAELTLAAPASKPAIVALIENGTAKPATSPKVHPDQAGASMEAERLALQFPGQQFGVFVLAGSKIADLVSVPTAVLRAA